MFRSRNVFRSQIFWNLSTEVCQATMLETPWKANQLNLRLKLSLKYSHTRNIFQQKTYAGVLASLLVLLLSVHLKRKCSVLSCPCVLHVLIPRLPKSLYLNKKRDGGTVISRELKLINQIAFCSVFIIFSNQSHLQYSRIPLHRQNEIRRWNGILNEISKINAPNATAGKKIKWGDLLPCGVFVFFQNCSFVFI